MKSIIICTALLFYLVGISNSYQDITKDEAWDVVNKFYKDILRQEIDFYIDDMKMDRIMVNKIGNYPVNYYRTIRTNDITLKINTSNNNLYEWVDSKSLYDSYEQGKEKSSTEIKPIHDKEQVKDLALEFLSNLNTKTGIPSGIKGPEIYFDESSLGWVSFWDRTIGKYNFDKEKLVIILKDKDLSIRRYSNTFTHKTCDLTINVTEEQAVKIANEYFSNKGNPERPSQIERGKGEFADLEIKYPIRAFIEPNVFEEGPRVTKPRKKNEPIVLPEIVVIKPHLVYVVKFEMRYSKESDPNSIIPSWPMEMWVDAKTGDIVGGQ